MASGLLGGYGAPVDARASSYYEWTIRLLNRYMRQSVVGCDGVSSHLRWTSIQLNAFVTRAHVDGANTVGAKAVVIAFGD